MAGQRGEPRRPRTDAQRLPRGRVAVSDAGNPPYRHSALRRGRGTALEGTDTALCGNGGTARGACESGGRRGTALISSSYFHERLDRNALVPAARGPPW